MFQPPGFELRSVMTSLGKMVYSTSNGELWPAKETETSETLVFWHGFGGGSSSYECSKVYPAFAWEYRVLAPDLIGWGKSNHPERNYLPQLTVPTAFIWGKKSQFTGPEIGQRLANLNPQAIRYFEQLEGVGLTPQLELPAVTIGLIRKFISLLA